MNPSRTFKQAQRAFDNELPDDCAHHPRLLRNRRQTLPDGSEISESEVADDETTTNENEES